MKNWEYQITRYQVQDVRKSEEIPEGAFYCDQKGQCFLHDTSHASAGIIAEVFNEEGKRGWELIQFGYHLGELICVWKRPIA